MILSLSGISTIGSSFAEDVEAHAKAGFDAIGLWEFKLRQMAALLRERGLRAPCPASVRRSRRA